MWTTQCTQYEDFNTKLREVSESESEAYHHGKTLEQIQMLWIMQESAL